MKNIIETTSLVDSKETKKELAYHAEASELGWKPSVWPTNFEYKGRKWYRVRKMDMDGEFGGYEYNDAGSHAILFVFND